jgi:hypothetical protein
VTQISFFFLQLTSSRIFIIEKKKKTIVFVKKSVAVDAVAVYVVIIACANANSYF